MHPEKMTSFSDEPFFHFCTLSSLLLSLPTAFFLQFLQAPYGKHRRPGWGPTLPPPLAWFFMESPTLFLTLLLFPAGRHKSDPKSILLISPFLLHYTHRTLIYPLRLHLRRTTTATTVSAAGFPISVAAMGFVFNLLNSYLQSRWVSHYADYDGDTWFWWRFSGGLAVFLGGMAVNMTSDAVLLGLKGDGGGYKIPKGGLFDLVSCPNYFGEILEWLGWAFMSCSWAGLSFLFYTCANLVPRAQAHHRWYLQKFGEDYPRHRKAVIPFLF